MRLGLNVGYWGLRGDMSDDLALVREAERLGFAVAWVAEAYGSDAVTVLSWLAAQTTDIDLGAAILQIPARTPTMTAMTAATLDALSGGRFRLGLGVSGPQVSEGWYGVKFAKPLARTREYVQIVRTALARERVDFHGETYEMPLPGGPGKALHLMMRPVRDDMPLYIAAIGPKNLELTGEVADGWLSVFFAPDHAAESLQHIAAGRAKVGKDLTGFDVAATVPVVIGDDIEACADPVRRYAALYIGGMGSREQNFYNRLACGMGFDDAAGRIQDLYLERKYDEAAAAVPLEFIDATSLLGPVERIADRMAAFADAGVTTLSLATYADTPDEQVAALRGSVEALEKAGLATA